jgi:hypothetical protein
VFCFFQKEKKKVYKTTNCKGSTQYDIHRELPHYTEMSMYEIDQVQMCILTVEKKDLTRGLRDAEQDFRCCQN